MARTVYPVRPTVVPIDLGQAGHVTHRWDPVTGMSDAALSILYLTHASPSPPRTGAQRRMHGLATNLARRHRLVVVSLVEPDEAGAVAMALREYAREVVVVPRTRALSHGAKRILQLRSLLSPRSFERFLFAEPRLLRAAEDVLDRIPFDIVNVETPFLFKPGLRRAPSGARPPRVVVAEHNVEYDILRQVARGESGAVRRAYNSANWRKVRREEEAAWRQADGVVLTSKPDEARVRTTAPGTRTAVVPNAADIEYFRPQPGAPLPDGRTILFFGAGNYFPNTDGILYFLREIWPALAARRPDLRFKIVGPNPSAEVLARSGPRIEVVGFVEDLRPHLATAAALVVPLRIGGGTRLKILEAMAMAKPIVSTTLGAEGIEVTDGANILLADAPAAFAGAVERVLDDRFLAARLGHGGRTLVEARYSWEAAGCSLEQFFQSLTAKHGA